MNQWFLECNVSSIYIYALLEYKVSSIDIFSDFAQWGGEGVPKIGGGSGGTVANGGKRANHRVNFEIFRII
jgi:hypothetical protein